MIEERMNEIFSLDNLVLTIHEFMLRHRGELIKARKITSIQIDNLLKPHYA